MGDRLMRSIEDSVMASGVIVADGVIEWDVVRDFKSELKKNTTPTPIPWKWNPRK
ncbi:hypothetical protein KIN20_003428 [Parelaphostrongylus tenuis]|uniref:Uncharacterized protein n=1 Tax=Parelaphostrongylus tenuis TaxID=148309 RepID=A0AAD5LWR0_PARTN|nr:hypothetical protein KIN20_003428 [Parelaphostrongylus tenuis]